MLAEEGGHREGHFGGAEGEGDHLRVEAGQVVERSCQRVAFCSRERNNTSEKNKLY